MSMKIFLDIFNLLMIFVRFFFKFDIHCEDSYKLALIGTVNNIGRALFLPLTGILSDKYASEFEHIILTRF